MIVYQLPSGKIVYLSVDQLLRLTDNDVKQLDDSNIGSSGHNPFRKLPGESAKDKFNEDLKDEEDDSIDFTDLDDEDSDEPFNMNRFLDD
jgi:hypothetical protein